MNAHLFQFVCFQTSLPLNPFLRGWSAFAQSFLAQGIERIVLGESTRPEARFGFISRNAWPPARFEATFRGQLPGDAGGGPVVAVQGGAFRLEASSGMEPLVMRGDFTKVVALVQQAGANHQATLRRLAVEQDRGAGWALYGRAPQTRGGRFDAVLELYVPPQAALEVEDQLERSLARAPDIRGLEVQTLREVYALP